MRSPRFAARLFFGGSTGRKVCAFPPLASWPNTPIRPSSFSTTKWAISCGSRGSYPGAGSITDATTPGQLAPVLCSKLNIAHQRDPTIVPPRCWLNTRSPPDPDPRRRRGAMGGSARETMHLFRQEVKDTATAKVRSSGCSTPRTRARDRPRCSPSACSAATSWNAHVAALLHDEDPSCDGSLRMLFGNSGSAAAHPDQNWSLQQAVRKPDAKSVRAATRRPDRPGPAIRGSVQPAGRVVIQGG